MKHDFALFTGGSLEGLSLPRQDSILVPKINQLAVTDTMKLVRWTNEGNWLELVPTGELPLFNFDTFLFISPVRGQSGPSINDLRTSAQYQNTPWVADNSFFSVASGIQNFTVPRSGVYRIAAVGTGVPHNGRALTRVGCDVVLARGDTLRILTGQTGVMNIPYGILAGGGGTFVESASRGLILVAGGCGAQRNGGQTPNVVALDESTASAGGTGLASGGANFWGAGGGAGYSENAAASTHTVPARSFLNGGLGGSASSGGNNSNFAVSQAGGFGGGGGGSGITAGSPAGARFGGGGGYIGGNAGQDNTGGAFGRSFISSKPGITNRLSTSIANTGTWRNGSVELSFLSEVETP